MNKLYIIMLIGGLFVYGISQGYSLRVDKLKENNYSIVTLKDYWGLINK